MPRTRHTVGRLRSTALSILAFFGLALGSVGCSDSPTEPGAPREPALLAVSAPDSIVVGDSLRIRIHWQAGACDWSELVDLDTRNPRSPHVVLRVRDLHPDGITTGEYRTYETIVVLPPPPDGLVTLTTGESDEFQHVVHVGGAPGQPGRHRFEVERAGMWMSDGLVLQSWTGYSTDPDTVLLDSYGVGERVFPCPGSGAVSWISVSDETGPSAFFGLSGCAGPWVTEVHVR